MNQNGKGDYFCGVNPATTPAGNDLERAARILREGGLVAIPTETVYGLAANALDERAVLSIFQVKKRPTFDPLIVHLPHASAISLYATGVSEMALSLAGRFWPGPLTLVLRRGPRIPDLVSSGLDTVALRVPNHPIALDLLNRLPFPLAAPSANPFGYVSPTRSSHVQDQLGGRIDYILEGGTSSVGLESTVVDLTGRLPVILRRGGIPEEELEEFLGFPLQKTLSSSRPGAPGMLVGHYAPRCPLLTYSGDEWKSLLAGMDAAIAASAAWLRFSTTLPVVAAGQQFILSESGDLTVAARNLFRLMRELDDRRPGVILAERVPDSGLGRAINDRLTRASAPQSIAPQPDFNGLESAGC